MDDAALCYALLHINPETRFDLVCRVVDQAAARIAALERDAARYHFLRRFDHFAVVDAMLDTTQYNTLDAAVDAAIARRAIK